jgi:transcriptional regulator with XRE-family HTH domain
MYDEKSSMQNETANSVVGRQVAAARKALRPSVSQAELLKRLDALGVAMDQATLSNIETGKRRVRVDDLLAIAAALGIAPLELLAGWLTNEPVPITPKISRRSLEMRRWLRGEQALEEQTTSATGDELHVVHDWPQGARRGRDKDLAEVRETYFGFAPNEEQLARQWRGVVNIEQILRRDLKEAVVRDDLHAMRRAVQDMGSELRWLKDEIAHEQERAERAQKED